MINMDYHPAVARIQELLTQNGVSFETFEHEAVRTSEEASRVRTGYTLEQGAKALIVRAKEAGKEKRFVMFVMPAHLRLDTAKVKANLGFSDVRFATEAEVGELTSGVLPGGVPPFGNLFDLPVYVDERLSENERIVFNAGDRRFSIGMKSEDYLKLVVPVVDDITE